MRDNALVNALRHLGHDAVLVPMYLPMMLDEKKATPEAPLFFGGINVYLQQKSAIFRHTPRWIDKIFDSAAALSSAAKRVGMTRPSELGDLTISMLQGEEGKQAKEVERLMAWMKTERPDAVILSNALLLGVARRVKRETPAAVICTFQGEDSFLDSLPEPDRTKAWKTLEERAGDCDAFISVSRYYADVVCNRIRIPRERMNVVYNGIDLSGYSPRVSAPSPHVLGFLAHLTPVKGLETLIDAYILLRSRGSVPNLQLSVAGSANSADQPFVHAMKQKIDSARLSEDTKFLTNLNRAEKIEFLRGLSVLSVPATYGEAFGLYLLEAWAAGVPVVQPRSGAFPELLADSGGGLLCEPDDPKSLADSIETLLLDPVKAAEMGARGRASVLERYSVESMARGVAAILESAVQARKPESSVIGSKH
jgi:glycosyltransferase involved in cell wall biosynthesis